MSASLRALGGAGPCAFPSGAAAGERGAPPPHSSGTWRSGPEGCLCLTVSRGWDAERLCKGTPRREVGESACLRVTYVTLCEHDFVFYDVKNVGHTTPASRTSPPRRSRHSAIPAHFRGFEHAPVPQDA